MLSAFTARPIVELKPRDKSKIESILSYGDRLLVGLNTGSLRVYRINEAAVIAEDGDQQQQSNPSTDESTAAPKQKIAELLQEFEKFSRAKIEQLAIVKEANILISSSNGFVSTHDLHSFELQEQLAKTKGASAFAVTSNIVKDPSTGVPSIVSRLAVAVKRRVLLWSWRDMEVEGGTEEIALVSGVKTLTWASGTKLVAGLNQGYVMIDVQTQEVENIVGPGSIGGVAGQDTGRLGGTMSYIGMGGMVANPLATRLGEGEMLLAKDVNTHFVDTEKGQALGRKQIRWTAAPQAIGHSYPYLLALQDSSNGTLEVRNPETLSLLQSINLTGANLLQVAQPNISLAHAGKGFLVASDRIIWRMGALGYDEQIDALVKENYLDEAISLLGMLEDALVQDKEGRLREIKMQKAQQLFDAGKFRDSLDLFTEVAAPPGRVIRLYPPVIAGNLATKDNATPDGDDENATDAKQDNSPRKEHKRGALEATSEKSKKDEANPSITALRNQAEDKSDARSVRTVESTSLGTNPSDKELKPAVRELQAFLADVRRRLKIFFNPDNTLKDLLALEHSGMEEENERIIDNLLGISPGAKVDKGQLLIETATLVDTTLFRAHMYATPSLAGSLFRIANFCDPDVVMAKLEETGRFNDLIDFLFGKRLHRQALESLRKFGQAENEEETAPQLHGPARSVTYLQNLGPEMIDLILEFAEWPIRTQPELGMEIFLADTENAENLPRQKVTSFLLGIDKSLAIRYLEHVIDEWDDQTNDLHQQLLSLYLERLSSKDIDEHESHETQRKLIEVLKTSSHYSPAKILGQLPRESAQLYEARAVVFSKMGQHKQALEIYIFGLENPAQAEEYCNKVYLVESQEAVAKAAALQKTRPRKLSTVATMTDAEDAKSSVYHTLLSLYVKPPRGQKPLWGPAIELLARHGARLPASETLDLIPESVLVRELEFYFRGRIRGANEVVGNGRVEAGLRKVEAVRTQRRLLLGDKGGVQPGGRNRRVRVDEEKVCGVCYKRLGGSVISVFPDNSVVHLGCASRKQ